MPRDDSQARQLILELLGPALRRSDLCAAEIDDSFNLIDAGLLDSIGFLQLLAQLEEHSGSPLDLYDINPDRLTTLGGLVALAADTAPSPPRRSLGND